MAEGHCYFRNTAAHKEIEASPDLGFFLTPGSLEPLPVHGADMVSTERLLLSCLLNICTKLSTDGGAVMVDLLVEDGFWVELTLTLI